MAKKKAKKTLGTQALLNVALTAAETSCLALDTAYWDFDSSGKFNKGAINRARKAATKVLETLDLL